MRNIRNVCVRVRMYTERAFFSSIPSCLLVSVGSARVITAGYRRHTRYRKRNSCGRFSRYRRNRRFDPDGGCSTLFRFYEFPLYRGHLFFLNRSCMRYDGTVTRGNRPVLRTGTTTMIVRDRRTHARTGRRRDGRQTIRAYNLTVGELRDEKNRNAATIRRAIVPTTCVRGTGSPVNGN